MGGDARPPNSLRIIGRHGRLGLGPQSTGIASTLIGARRLDQLTANPAALNVTLMAKQMASMNAVSKPLLSFPAGYSQISQMLGFPGTRIDGIQISPSPMRAASTARH
jgi:hypothetical protein